MGLRWIAILTVLTLLLKPSHVACDDIINGERNFIEDANSLSSIDDGLVKLLATLENPLTEETIDTQLNEEPTEPVELEYFPHDELNNNNNNMLGKDHLNKKREGQWAFPHKRQWTFPHKRQWAFPHKREFPLNSEI